MGDFLRLVLPPDLEHWFWSWFRTYLFIAALLGAGFFMFAAQRAHAGLLPMVMIVVGVLILCGTAEGLEGLATAVSVRMIRWIAAVRKD